ncbi:LysR substrate-binding domain-containing protein [Agrobacterium sp. SHOUNA12C]|nr:LysR substrate-binding domain-containing protein [Agrobacterium sp. BETTINA12B]MCJ9755104.1 LysR substrate-binding domain-containing protein [Agrobacterium sp. SHOUNA12C]
MRNPTLRQLEALMAVVEAGTVSRASEILRISQPAASKLIQDLEADTGLRLFDRESGRLVATARGMRLYEEVERIFGGVHQVARVVDAIRREEHGRLVIGTLPALSGPFISQILKVFLERYPNVFISVEVRSSQYLAEAVLSRRLDVALVTRSLEHSSVLIEPLEGSPVVAVFPIGHSLGSKQEISAHDLADEPFIAFAPTGLTRLKVEAVFEAQGVRPNIVMEATTAQNVLEFVAVGLGVTVADPLSLGFVGERVIVRPFRPSLTIDYQIVRPVRARSSSLVADFVEEVHVQAAKLGKIP